MTVSVRRRFVFTVGANLLRSVLSFVTGMLLARWLGPESFGKLAFLLGTFVALRQLLDMGSSTAFFTFMSQRLRSRRFVNAFFAWIGLQFLIPLCAVGLLFPAHWVELIWRGEQRGLVLLAFAATFMQNTLWPVIQQAAESQRQTLRVQAIAVIVVAVHLLAVALLWILGNLGLYALLAAIVLEYLFAAAIARGFLDHVEHQSIDNTGWPLFRQYLRYCLPLIPYTWVGFAYEFADRWLLQRYGGNVQQAYYAVSAQFAAIALIATTSILNIFWKEVAEAHHKGDHARTAMLYRKVTRLMFFVGATIAGFLCYWSDDLLNLMLGTAYAGGALTLTIMFLYPIHQSLGHIASTMLYATERVSIQVIGGIAFMVVSIAVTYFVLAPKDAAVPGLELAAVGLALKMVGLQFVQVNLMHYIISRVWRWRFDWIYQPISLLGCAGIGWFAHTIATGVGSLWPTSAVIGVGGLMYVLMVGAFLYSVPSAAGMTRGDLALGVATTVRHMRAVFTSS